MEANDEDVKEITDNLGLNMPQKLKLRSAIASLKNKRMNGKEENVNQWRKNMEAKQQQMLDTLKLLSTSINSIGYKASPVNLDENILKRNAMKKSASRKKKRQEKSLRKSKSMANNADNSNKRRKIDTESKERHEIYNDNKRNKMQKATKSSRKKRRSSDKNAYNAQRVKNMNKIKLELHMVDKRLHSDECNVENIYSMSEEQLDDLKKNLEALKETQLKITMNNYNLI